MATKPWYAWATPSGPINLMKEMPVHPNNRVQVQRHEAEIRVIKDGEVVWQRDARADDYAWSNAENHAHHLKVKLLAEYEAALQRAKESSVPIQDQDRARLLIVKSSSKGWYHDTGIYGPFTVEYRIEMDVCHADKETGGCDSRECCLRSAIAILYDDTPEEDIDIQFAESAKAHIRNAPAKTYRAVPEKEPQGIPKAFDYVGFMKKQYGEETQESILDELINDTFGATSAGRKSILEKFTITRKQ